MSLFTRATGLSLLFWSLLSLKVSSTRSDTPKIDIGGVGKCVKLNSTACSRFNYSVPESISYLTSIKDYYINDIIGRLSVTETDADCQEEMRELLCLKEYPQCSEEKGTVNVPETNCSQLLQSCQKKDSLSQFCSFVLTDSRLRECKPVSHHASNYNYSLTQCNAIDNGITEWNFLYLKKRDQDIASELKLIKSVGRTNEECEERYKGFRCGSIAYCSSEDTRLKLLTDRNECLYLRNHCLSNIQSRLVSHSIQCELWPEYTPEPSPSQIPSSLLGPSQQHTTSLSSSVALRPSVRPSTVSHSNLAVSGGGKIAIATGSIILVILCIFVLNN